MLVGRLAEHCRPTGDELFDVDISATSSLVLFIEMGDLEELLPRFEKVPSLPGLAAHDGLGIVGPALHVDPVADELVAEVLGQAGVVAGRQGDLLVHALEFDETLADVTMAVSDGFIIVV